MGNNVSVPFSGFIQGGITVGSDVVIIGMPLPHCNRFSINLCSGPTCDSDTALHFNPRFDQQKVVRNHRQGGSWGLEELNGGMPFHKGHNFEIHVKVEQQGYKITVNKKHFCNFHHRIPKERVQYLFIDGDVLITIIQYKGQCGYPTGNIAPPPNTSISKLYPGLPSHPCSAAAVPSYPGLPSHPYPAAAVPSYPSHPLPVSGPMYNPPVPLVTPIPGSLYHGRIIYITGVPQHNPSRFYINLACGAHDSADIGLHFDARFNYGTNKNVVVRNHKVGNKWGTEERHQNYFPFTPGVSFEIMILAETSCYKIAVNNQHFTEFFHRIYPFQKANYLNIIGDVQVTQVRFQ